MNEQWFGAVTKDSIAFTAFPLIKELPTFVFYRMLTLTFIPVVLKNTTVSAYLLTYFLLTIQKDEWPMRKVTLSNLPEVSQQVSERVQVLFNY